jgi:hypothetical protein
MREHSSPPFQRWIFPPSGRQTLSYGSVSVNRRSAALVKFLKALNLITLLANFLTPSRSPAAPCSSLSTSRTRTATID